MIKTEVDRMDSQSGRGGLGLSLFMLYRAAISDTFFMPQTVNVNIFQYPTFVNGYSQKNNLRFWKR